MANWMETAIDYWAEKIGYSKKEKSRKKRMKLREAKKLQRQTGYGKNKLGAKAVRNQRRKKRQMKQIYGE